MQLGHARSALFVPGTRPDRFAKALASGADAVLLDLEDAVAPGSKAAARQHVVDWLIAHPASAAVRLNGAGTPEHAADVEALAACSPLAVVLPKAQSAQDLRVLHEQLPGVALVPLVETAAGLLAAAAIAGAPGVVRLAFGSVDLQLDLDLPDEDVQATGTAFMTARFWLATASRAADLAAPLDGVTTAIGDDDRLRLESGRAGSGSAASCASIPGRSASFTRCSAPRPTRWSRRAASWRRRTPHPTVCSCSTGAWSTARWSTAPAPCSSGRAP